MGAGSHHVRFDAGDQGRRHGSLFSHSVGPPSLLVVRPTRTGRLCARCLARVAPQADGDHRDGDETHEHARDHDVSSASAADNLFSMPSPATPGNATALVPAASWVPAAPDESLCVEAESASASTPTTISSAPAREADAGTAGSGCKRCTAGANAGRVGPHTCGKKRSAPTVVARARSSRQRVLESSLSLLPPLPEPTSPRQPLPPAEAPTTSPQAPLIDNDNAAGSHSNTSDVEMVERNGSERDGPETAVSMALVRAPLHEHMCPPRAHAANTCTLFACMHHAHGP